MSAGKSIANNRSPASRGNAPRIAFIQACWHADIVERCRDSFVAAMQEAGIDGIDLFKVPGGFEIPLLAKRLAQSGRYSAIVASALIVDGGIYRHDFVADAVISGMMQVQLETGTPVLSAVLTPQHFHEHDEHRRFFSEHFTVKGAELAHACLRTLENMEQLQSAA